MREGIPTMALSDRHRKQKPPSAHLPSRWQQDHNELTRSYNNVTMGHRWPRSRQIETPWPIHNVDRNVGGKVNSAKAHPTGLAVALSRCCITFQKTHSNNHFCDHRDRSIDTLPQRGRVFVFFNWFDILIENRSLTLMKICFVDAKHTCVGGNCVSKWSTQENVVCALGDLGKSFSPGIYTIYRTCPIMKRLVTSNSRVCPGKSRSKSTIVTKIVHYSLAWEPQ